MFGIGHYSGGGGTDKVLTLMVGAGIPVNGKKFKVRVEIGPVFDLFVGGHDVAWRYAGNIAFPLG